MGAQILQSHTKVDAVGSDVRVSTAAVRSNVHLAESETFVPASIGEESSNGTEATEVSGNTPFEEIDKVEPIKVNHNASLVRALDENPANSVSICQFSRNNYDTIESWSDYAGGVSTAGFPRGAETKAQGFHSPQGLWM